MYKRGDIISYAIHFKRGRPFKGAVPQTVRARVLRRNGSVLRVETEDGTQRWVRTQAVNGLCG